MGTRGRHGRRGGGGGAGGGASGGGGFSHHSSGHGPHASRNRLDTSSLPTAPLATVPLNDAMRHNILADAMPFVPVAIPVASPVGPNTSGLPTVVGEPATVPPSYKSYVTACQKYPVLRETLEKLNKDKSLSNLTVGVSDHSEVAATMAIAQELGMNVKPGSGVVYVFKPKVAKFGPAPLAVASEPDPIKPAMDFHSQMLQRALDTQFPLQSPAERAAYRGAVDRLARLTRQWLDTQFGAVKGVLHGGQVVPFGSYALGLEEPGIDIDALCVTSSSVAPSMFFTDLPALLRTAGATDVMVIEARVPLISVTLSGIRFDVLWARLPFATLSAHQIADISGQLTQVMHAVLDGQLDILPAHQAPTAANSAAAVMDSTARSISAALTTQQLLSLVPDVDTFRLVLRTVRSWARQRAIYGAKLGYLGGVSWACLVAYACANATAATPPAAVLLQFFVRFSQWQWRTAPVHFWAVCALCVYCVLLSHAPLLQPHITFPEEFPRPAMRILPPYCFPGDNAAYNVTHSTLYVIRMEMGRARDQIVSVLHNLCAQMIQLPYLDPVPVTGHAAGSAAPPTPITIPGAATGTASTHSPTLAPAMTPIAVPSRAAAAARTTSDFGIAGPVKVAAESVQLDKSPPERRRSMPSALDEKAADVLSHIVLRKVVSEGTPAKASPQPKAAPPADLGKLDDAIPPAESGSESEAEEKLEPAPFKPHPIPIPGLSGANGWNELFKPFRFFPAPGPVARPSPSTLNRAALFVAIDAWGIGDVSHVFPLWSMRVQSQVINFARDLERKVIGLRHHGRLGAPRQTDKGPGKDFLALLPCVHKFHSTSAGTPGESYFLKITGLPACVEEATGREGDLLSSIRQIVRESFDVMDYSYLRGWAYQALGPTADQHAGPFLYARAVVLRRAELPAFVHETPQAARPRVGNVDTHR